MKKWSNEEIAMLKTTVSRHKSVSEGIRAFMVTHPDRSFQACSHVLYRKTKDAPVRAVPVEPAAEVVNETHSETTKAPEKKSFWKKVVSLFIKPKAEL